MKRLFIAVALILGMSGAISAQQSYTRNGNTFAVTKSTRDVRAGADSTKFTIQDGQHVRAIWVVRSTGSCFYIRVSKKGNEYRQYCPKEMSAAICAELGREYKPRTTKKEGGAK